MIRRRNLFKEAVFSWFVTPNEIEQEALLLRTINTQWIQLHLNADWRDASDANDSPQAAMAASFPPLQKDCLPYRICKKSYKITEQNFFTSDPSIHIRDYVLHLSYSNYAVSWLRTKLICAWETSMLLSKHSKVFPTSISYKLKNDRG